MCVGNLSDSDCDCVVFEVRRDGIDDNWYKFLGYLSKSIISIIGITGYIRAGL